MVKTRYVTDTEFDRLIKTTKASNVFPCRNVALLLLEYGTGMTLSELSVLRVSVYLSPNGSIKVDSCVPADVAYNGTARPLYWTNQRLVAALDEYLAYRVAHNHGTTTKKGAYRSLDPESTLICTDDGDAFGQTKRKNQSGKISTSPDSLGEAFRNLHEKAGIEGVSAESARRRFAVTLARKGFGLEHIRVLVGHKSLSTTKKW
jgi:site-specific recombinase XerD